MSLKFLKTETTNSTNVFLGYNDLSIAMLGLVCSFLHCKDHLARFSPVNKNWNAAARRASSWPPRTEFIFDGSDFEIAVKANRLLNYKFRTTHLTLPICEQSTVKAIFQDKEFVSCLQDLYIHYAERINDEEDSDEARQLAPVHLCTNLTTLGIEIEDEFYGQVETSNSKFPSKLSSLTWSGECDVEILLPQLGKETPELHHLCLKDVGRVPPDANYIRHLPLTNLELSGYCPMTQTFVDSLGEFVKLTTLVLVETADSAAARTLSALRLLPNLRALTITHHEGDMKDLQDLKLTHLTLVGVNSVEPPTVPEWKCMQTLPLDTLVLQRMYLTSCETALILGQFSLKKLILGGCTQQALVILFANSKLAKTLEFLELATDEFLDDSIAIIFARQTVLKTICITSGPHGGLTDAFLTFLTDAPHLQELRVLSRKFGRDTVEEFHRKKPGVLRVE